MTATYAPSLQATPSLRQGPRTVATAAAGAMAAPLLSTLIAFAIDPRTINGASVWLKPMHFELSLALHFATLALLLPLASRAWQSSRLVRGSMLAAATCAVLEVAYISLQAARGEASHFNYSSPVSGAMYALMGLGALIIVIGSAVTGLAIWRSRGVRGDSQLGRGAALGLVLGSGATLALAGYMSSQGSHLVGGPPTDAFGLPFLGWATRGGDLRVPHFFATHAMQALPLAGLAADRLGLAARWAMPAAAALYFVAVLALFGQALMGIPFIGL